MATINANTPQLEAVQRWIDGYCSLDLRRIELLFSKVFKHQTLPKSLVRPEETREAYLKRFGEALPMFTSFNVCIEYQRSALKLEDRLGYPPLPIDNNSRGDRSAWESHRPRSSLCAAFSSGFRP